MGVRGLSTFVRDNQLFEKYQLHDTPLVIDGLNLVFALYFKFQAEKRNDHMYGGDYSLWNEYVRNFLGTLRRCGVTPIIILDGSFDPSLEKLQTLLHRARTSLATARKIYANNCLNEGINPLHTLHVFVQAIIAATGVHFYRSIYEADEVIATIGHDLRCPVLSNDSDFLIDHLPGGVIPVDFLLHDFRLHTANHPDDGNDDNNDRSPPYKYLNVRIYRLSFMQRKFPGMELDLVQICGAILGNDYLDSRVTNCILARLPKFDSSAKSTSSSNRQKQISCVLRWISRFDSYESILIELRKYINDANHPLLQYIERNFIARNHRDHAPYDSIAHYFERNMERLFYQKQKVNIPRWVAERFVSGQFHMNLFTIQQAHTDWMVPLVEDFSFVEPTYECVFELCRYIYGLLRDNSAKDNNEPRNVKRYSRWGTQFVGTKVCPHIELTDENDYPKTACYRLPVFDEIISLSDNERLSLFYRILRIEPSLLDDLKRAFVGPDSNTIDRAYTIDASLLDELAFMLLAVVYMSQNFAHNIWLEFVYALFVNLVLAGHCCPEAVPVLLRFDHARSISLRNNRTLYSFNEIPTMSGHKVYMPRVVHFYNCFQVCLNKLTFLAQVLNLSSSLHANRYVCALNGTFIYNLTTDIATRSKPLLYLDELLGRQKFSPLQAFHRLLDTLLVALDRPLSIVGPVDKDVITSSFVNHDSVRQTNDTKTRFLVRAYEETNRKTHINAQELKLTSNRNRPRR